MNNCPICNTKLHFVFNAKILHAHRVSYFQCPNCAFLKTEEPFWLEDAYKNAIVDADTGLVQRNINISKKLAGILYFILDKNASYLDVAGGYGMLTRLMRDYGFHFYWSDPYCSNMLAKGFGHTVESPQKFEALTAFEVLEHIEKPIEFLNKLIFEHSCKTIIFSTELYEGAVPSELWWYYVFNEGQHISFYTKKTLSIISENLGLYFYSINGIHCFSKKPINKFLFRLVTGKFAELISRYVKRRMNSLTLSDHQSLVDKKII